MYLSDHLHLSIYLSIYFPANQVLSIADEWLFSPLTRRSLSMMLFGASREKGNERASDVCNFIIMYIFIKDTRREKGSLASERASERDTYRSIFRY